MRRTLASIALVVLACVGLGSGGAAASTAAERPPTRIVSLSATATEMLYAIGAGEQVVAVDDQSNYPERAPRTALSAYRPNAEAIAGYEPDLVVTSSGSAARPLRRLGIDVLVLPAAEELDETYAQLRELGAATGHEGGARALATRMRADIKQIRSEVPERRRRPAVYYEIDSSLYSADSTTFIGQLLELAGLRNIADRATDAAPGYPQLSAEYVVDADPTVIFLADTKCCGQTAAKVATRPSFEKIEAVREGRVVELDDDVASRWGPRVVELYRQLVDATKGL